ncbi:MAG: hypothetical protein SNJ71_00790 [Bacteroidales bacterium]
MNEKELSLLAEKIAEKLKHTQGKCAVFTDADIAGIKEIAKLFSSGKSMFLKTILALIYIGIGTILLIGFKSWIKDFLKGL